MSAIGNYVMNKTEHPRIRLFMDSRGNWRPEWYMRHMAEANRAIKDMLELAERASPPKTEGGTP